MVGGKDGRRRSGRDEKAPLVSAEAAEPQRGRAPERPPEGPHASRRRLSQFSPKIGYEADGLAAIHDSSHQTGDCESSALSSAQVGGVSRYAAFSQTGRVPVNPRKVNQDSFWTIEDRAQKYSFFGVADGHGVVGHKVSGLISRQLPQSLLRELARSDASTRKALDRAFKKTNQAVLSADMDVTLSGSSCVSVLIKDSKIIGRYCANTGDSRAVLGRRSNGGQWTALPLSNDHKPDSPDELKRITKMGGRVEPFRTGIFSIPMGPSRVWLKKQDLPGLAMSRAFGDTIAASIGVTAEPEISKHTISNEDKLVVLASDGVWDFMPNEEVIQMDELDLGVRKIFPKLAVCAIGYFFDSATRRSRYYNQENCRKAARAVVKEASERWQSNEEVVDDITCVVVFLAPRLWFEGWRVAFSFERLIIITDDVNNEAHVGAAEKFSGEFGNCITSALSLLAQTSSQASSPVNLSPRVDDSAVGPNGTPKGFAAEKRVASPAPDVCGPRRKSQRLASRSQPENDVLVEDHGSEEGSGKSESSSSSGSDTYEDSGHEQPDERAQRLERRRAGIPASAAEVKVEEQDAQRYPKRERIEISRYGDGKRHRKRPDGTRSRIETSFLLKRPEQLIADMAGPLDTRVGQPSSLLATGASAGSRGISFLNETIDCSELEGWDAIGGETVRRHIHHVVESVLLPLVYPELFKGLGVSPPRGLLLHGPPGTGKTLLARCLAGSCSRLGGGAKVSFFMRKGADVLSKWVGEGERLLRELFDQARKAQPSIIFFDEIDGLAPVRIGCSGANSSDPVASGGSSHSSSLVATLLALMDGLDGRGEHVVVLAATNRPDAVDPALRRPGRFDKELRFSPPRGAAERRAVLEVHTRKWRSDQMPPGTAAWICDPSRTAGFTGADLKALTEEAVMMAVRRTYPQIYEEAIRQTSGDLNGAKRRSTLRQKFMVSASNVVVTPLDFTAALKKIVPSSRRRSQHATAAGNGNSLAVASPLTSKLFASQITSLCSTILEALGQQEGKDDLNCGGVEVSTESPRKVISRVISPATGVILKTDDPTSILQYVLPGVSLAIQERGVGVFVIDMCGVSTGQQAVLDTVEAALQNTPSLLLITDDVRCVEDRLRAGELEGATSAMIEACTCLSSLLMSRVAVHGSGVLTLVLTHTVVASDADPAPWSADFDVLDMRMDMPVEFVSGWLAELLAEQVEENVRLVQREEHARQCAAVELPKTVYKFEQPSSESSSMKWESLSRKEMDTMRKEEDHWFRILRIQIREILKSLREFPAYRRWFYSPVDLEVYTDYSREALVS
ncbi:hypothetical protein FOZ61_005758 [Perkinsus olseni]|uniref:PPM-type phosphatase domain-containing protein n=1 Tax=Perkinsus olseni TaxID=32597 RepID=A0A7J6LG12_PEROL|nr:hypothetical protein FOZ61_005758 [Perkinsus olseni]